MNFISLDSAISFPFISGVESATTHLSSLLGGPLPPSHHPSKTQSIFQYSVDHHHFSSLLNSSSLRDRARVRGVSHHSCASAWLWAIPSGLLGLTMSGHEFVVSLRYWLGISLFPVSARCSCGSDSLGVVMVL